MRYRGQTEEDEGSREAVFRYQLVNANVVIQSRADNADNTTDFVQHYSVAP